VSRTRVLGYGALLDPEHVRRLCGASHVLAFRVGRLTGWRRHWNLIYRNGCWDEGGFVDAATGERWDGGVAFLGVEEAPGVVMPVSEIEVDGEGLAAIDAEEFMYRRVDVTGQYARDDGSTGDGPVWLYRDVPEEFPGAVYVGERVAVNRGYHDGVRAAAGELWEDGLREFEGTTEPCRWEVRSLVWESSSD